MSTRTPPTPRWLARYIDAAHDTTAERETFVPPRLADPALKASYLPAPVVWSDFSDEPDGAPATLDSGQPWDFTPGYRPMTVAGGALTLVKPPSGGWAGYANVNLTADVDRIGADFSFAPDTGSAGGSAAFVLWGGPTYVPNVSVTKCHFVTTRTGWAYWVRDPGSFGGVLTTIASGSYDAPLAVSTRYRFDCQIVGTTAYLLLPDGSTATVTHACLGTLPARVPCWEPYAEPVDGAAALARFHRVWADTARATPGGRSLPDEVRKLRQAGPGAVRALSYAPATSGDVLAPTGLADVNATQLKLPVTVPASGKILVELTGYVAMTGPGQLLWGVANGATDYGVQTVVNQQYTGLITYRQVIGGLTPGQVMNFRWRHFCTVASVATFKLHDGNGYHATMTATPLAA